MISLPACCRRPGALAAAGALVFGVSGAWAQGFNLEFDFQSTFTASQFAVFDEVEVLYESLITGYQPSVTGLTGAVIDVSAAPIDGPFDFENGTGFIAGQGGGSFNGVPNGGFQFFVTDNTGTRTTGNLLLDSEDLGTLEGFTDGLFNIIFHEVGHALGFGTLWEQNSLLDASGQYIGANGLAAYQDEFDPLASVAPTDGTNPGNAGHWEESSLLGSDIFSPTLVLGGSNPLTQTSIAAFADLGYTVVPEPAAACLLVFGGALLVRRRTA